jgi:hypothetical protein
MDKKEERRLSRKIVREVGKQMRSSGFLHSKPSFLVRPLGAFALFMHFHRYRCSPCFRLHFGVRVMNDPFEAIALNGPCFEYAGTFEAAEDETLACTRTLIALIEREGQGWFSKFPDAEALYRAPGSPLQDRDRQALADDFGEKRNAARWRVSAQLLGLKCQREPAVLEGKFSVEPVKPPAPL